MKIIKSDQEWQQQLSVQQYRVTRQKGTERAFSGAYYYHQEPGVYCCVCCGNELFSSQTKYDSGSGWPSFWAPIAPENIDTADDYSLSVKRSEVLCSRCDAHLGHVFPDGPPPSGQRYCINSAALEFVRASDE